METLTIATIVTIGMIAISLTLEKLPNSFYQMLDEKGIL